MAPSVLFVSASANRDDGSRRYRCEHQAKQLLQAGLHVSVKSLDELTTARLDASDVAVLSRCAWDDRLAGLLNAARARGTMLFGDLDDRIFAPWDVADKGLLRSRAAVRRDARATARVSNTERNLLRLLPMFDFVLASTPSLADDLRSLGISSIVSRNAVDSERCRPVRRERFGLKRMVISAGTPTHDADLRSIAGPLSRFLCEQPHVKCTLVGALEMPGQLRGLRNVRVQRLLSPDALSPFLSEFDLCLVPLENTRFNDCKSGVKYLEAGLVSVPVLASPRAEQRALIEHGENGFLTLDDTEASWYSALYSLHEQPALIGDVARRAHQHVLMAHTVMSRRSQLAETIISLFCQARMPSKRASS